MLELGEMVTGRWPGPQRPEGPVALPVPPGSPADSPAAMSTETKERRDASEALWPFEARNFRS